MNKERIIKALNYVKGSPETMDYGKWGSLNIEQRNFIKDLCNSWLILDEATNIQQQRIDKAIEYIKSYLPNYDFDHSNLEKLLEILGDKENE